MIKCGLLVSDAGKQVLLRKKSPAIFLKPGVYYDSLPLNLSSIPITFS